MEPFLWFSKSIFHFDKSVGYQRQTAAYIRLYDAVIGNGSGPYINGFHQVDTKYVIELRESTFKLLSIKCFQK